MLLVVVQVLFALRPDSPIESRGLWGTDGYMRLARVATLHDSGNWYDGTSYRSNAPDGEVLHWTRPMDVVLLAGAALLAPVTGFTPALYWWGVWVGPALHSLRELVFYTGPALMAAPFLVYRLRTTDGAERRLWWANEANHYRGEPSAPTVYDQLERATPPVRLKPVALPAGLADSFRLFAVTKTPRDPAAR